MDSTEAKNIRDDAVIQVLGRDKPGRLRGLGRGVTITKLAFLQARDSHVEKLEATQAHLARKSRGCDDVSKSKEKNDKKRGIRCKLLDWCSYDNVVVGEGLFFSVEHTYKIGRVQIGRNVAAIKVTSVSAKDITVWRPTYTIYTLEEAMGFTIAWPSEKVIMNTGIEISEGSNSAGSSDKNPSLERVLIFDWNVADEIVAEGILCSTNPSEMYNNVSLGRNAAIVEVDKVVKPETDLFIPTSLLAVIGDAFNEKIAWPRHLVKPVHPFAREESAKKSPTNTSNSTTCNNTAKKKCILLDCNNSRETVAEGRVFSPDPADLVHSKPLGSNATKVLVEVSKVGGARVWRPNSEIEFISDAVGITVAWPKDTLTVV